MIAYHDEEWGVPVHDDRTLFEFLVLEGAQAGLSWSTILHKRESYRPAFAGFDPRRSRASAPREVEQLMHDAGIVRNRLKIESTIDNARAILTVSREHGLSITTSGALRRCAARDRGARGQSNSGTSLTTAWNPRAFRGSQAAGLPFRRSTICRHSCKRTGLVNDHVADCFRFLAHPEKSSDTLSLT